jgi:hypothetical protein
MIKATEWTGTILQVSGALWLALNLPSSGYAFPLMLAGCLFWIAISAREKRWSLFWMQAVFAVINVVGIVRWIA